MPVQSPESNVVPLHCACMPQTKPQGTCQQQAQLSAVLVTGQLPYIHNYISPDVTISNSII